MVLSIMSGYTARVQKTHFKAYPEDLKTLGEHIKKRRMDLGLSQAAAARCIGVSEDCLCYWENARNEPMLYQYPAVITFLGYYPLMHNLGTLGGHIIYEVIK